jgi:hypothetical protein
MRKETRGRKQKKHSPVDASFDEVLGGFARSRYTDKKTLKKKQKKKRSTH